MRNSHRLSTNARRGSLGAFALLAAGLLGCGGGLSSVLVSVTSLPPNTIRINAAISIGGKATTATFARDGNNRYIASSEMVRPAGAAAPASAQLAFDLPAGTSGSFVTRITVETGDPPAMGMTNPPPPTVTQEGCGRIDVSSGMLYNLAIDVRALPNPCPF
jgi:hypothetical protein